MTILKAKYEKGNFTAWKVYVFGVFLVRIFPYSDWIQRDTPHLSPFSRNAGKIRTRKNPNTDTFHEVFKTLNYTTHWKFLQKILGSEMLTTNYLLKKRTIKIHHVKNERCLFMVLIWICLEVITQSLLGKLARSLNEIKGLAEEKI